MLGAPIGAATAADDVLVPAAALHGFVVRIFRALGSGAREAGLVADHLVRSNLLGHDSHGISLIPLYARMVREGRVVPDTVPRTVLDMGTAVTLDAGRGFGQVAAHDAMVLAIERARTGGTVLVALRDSHHIGRIGHWAEQCTAAGLVSVHFVNVVGAPPIVAPYAGSDARLSTNPIAVGVPRPGKPPIILDFATSRAAQGKMRIAMNRGVSVPDGYLLDRHGQPSTDPAAVYDPPLGALLPFGDHKGAGLALVCEILAGAMSGGSTLHPGTMEEGVNCNNMLSMVFDPARLGGAGTWVAEMEAGTAFLQASPPRPGLGPVLLPGEPERMVEAERGTRGIPVDRTTWHLVGEAAAAVGVTPP